MRAAVIGLGVMGGAVAQRLVETGFDPLVHDIDPAAMARLVPGLEQVAAEAGHRLTAALAALTEEH